MPEKINVDNNVNKKDLELILEVNKKAIEIQTEVASQNEEIIEILDERKIILTQINEKIILNTEKVDKLVKQSDEMHKDLFKIQVLFITGLLSLVVQIVQIFLKK
jgi:uncharacterized coiled-coil DUF342 family protein